jgi:hypothetical protein
MWSCIIDIHADDSKYQENAIEISNCDIETAFGNSGRSTRLALLLPVEVGSIYTDCH